MSRRLIVIVGLILALLAVANVTGLLAPFQNISRAITVPIARSFSSAGRGIGTWLSRPLEISELTEQNVDLRARLDSAVVDYVRLRALEEENRSLRAMLEFEDESDYDFVPARIISRSSDEGRVEVLIDRGSRDGLEVGMAVVAEGGLFVGKITELQPRISRITLVSDEQSRIAASTAGRHALIGVIEGRGNGTANLTLIPQQIELNPDDIIVTAGTEEKIPANLPIGLINTVEGQQTDPFKHASIEPLLRIEGLDLVLVLRSSALRPESANQ
ncbi:MAG: rod shape-determining protein MreC [bacterium]|nr:rod shape-determining protein MreC [bacterium]